MVPVLFQALATLRREHLDLPSEIASNCFRYSREWQTAMHRLKSIALISAIGLAMWGCGPRSELECLKEAAETARTNVAFNALRAACEKEYAAPTPPEDPAKNEALATEVAANEAELIINPDDNERTQSSGKRNSLFADKPLSPVTK
jgi:hypothetical protein